MDKTEIENCMYKILDFARAIVLDKKNQSAGSIAATMAEEIEEYGNRVLESLLDKTETNLS